MSLVQEENYNSYDTYGIDNDQIKDKDTILLENATNEEDFQSITESLLKRIGRSQNSIEKSMEDLKKCINEYFNHHNKVNFVINLKKTIKQLNEIAIQYLNVERIELSLIILNECDTLTQTYNGFADMQILTFNNLSCYFRKCKDQKRALRLLEKAETVHQKNQTSTNIGITYLNKSAILSEMGRYTLINQHQEAIKCAKGAVTELKSQFEKAFIKKSERLDRKQNIKNFKNTLNSNQKVDDAKLEEEFNAREEENRQINQEFADIATELGIAYHNLATEEQYYKLFDKSIKNFYNAYLIVKEYLGDTHPLAIQFLQSFETTNKKYEQNQGLDGQKQRKQFQKINESPEYQQKNQNQNFNINAKAIQKMNSINNAIADDSNENSQKNFDSHQERLNLQQQESNIDAKMLQQYNKGNVQNHIQLPKQNNLPVHNLLYSDDEEDKQSNEMYSFKNLNAPSHIEKYKQQNQQPIYSVHSNNSMTKINQHTPTIYNYLYFDNPKDMLMQQMNQKQKQDFSFKQNQYNQNQLRVQRAQDLVDNASQCSESPRNNERRLRNLEIDEFIIKRNKSTNNILSPNGFQQQLQSPNEILYFDQKEQDIQSQKSSNTNDQKHPGFFLAKKMQGKYSKVGSIRPISAQEILSQPLEKKEVGGNKYKINPKLLIPDTIIEAANKYQDYLQRESSTNSRRNFVIKSQSQKNFNQIHKENIKNQEVQLHLNQHNRFDPLEKDILFQRSSVGKQKSIPFQNIGKFSTKTHRIQDKRQGKNKNNENNDENIKQQKEITKDNINLKQTNYEQERQKPIQKWNFESDPKPISQINIVNQEKQIDRCQTAKSSHIRQTSIKSQIKNSMNYSQKENKTLPSSIATEIPEEFLIISPYMNAAVKSKSDFFSIIKKGRLCCVFDEINYLLIIAFQDFQLGQGVEIEDQCKMYISFSQLKDIFAPKNLHEEKQKKFQHKEFLESLQYERELNNLKAELLHENLEMIFKKFKSIILIDQERKCLNLEKKFQGFTVPLKTPLHPKGIQTKINFPHPSQNASNLAILMHIQQNQSENQKNIKNLLIIEYPQEELFLQKENKKLDDLPEYFIILYSFQYTMISNKQGIIAVLLNCLTQQIQFIFRSLDQQLDLNHYIVVEHLIQDYGPFYESQDTQIALNLLCENLMTLWVYDGKNLTYQNNKWSLKNEVEIPRQGIKQFNYQIVQQPSNEISLIQKKEIWLEVYEEDDMFKTKRDQLDKIDESHESEDESRQEKSPLNRYAKKYPNSQFSLKDNNSRITNSIATNQNFQIVNKQDDEYYSEDEEYEQQFSQKTTPLQSQQEISKNKHPKSQKDQNLNYQNLQIQDNKLQFNSSSNNNQVNYINQQSQQQLQKQHENNVEKQDKHQRNQSHKNSNASNKQDQKQYDVNEQKIIFDQLDFEREQKQQYDKMHENQKKGSEQQHQDKNSLQEQEINQRDNSNNRQRNNSVNSNRPQSSRLQIDIKNNLQKGGLYTQQNDNQTEEDQTTNQQQTLYQENYDYSNKQNNQTSQKMKDQENKKKQADKQSVQREVIDIEQYKTTQNQTDIQSKRNSIRDRPEANHQKQRKESLQPQPDQKKKNYSLNVSQEKEGDVEYIDINDTQQIYY